MEITVFNMGYGESLLLKEGDDCLLVDCGSEDNTKDCSGQPKRDVYLNTVKKGHHNCNYHRTYSSDNDPVTEK